MFQEATQIPSNEIWYSTSDGNALDVKYGISPEDLAITSHKKEGGKFVIRLSGNLETLGMANERCWGEGTFSNTKIQCLRMPDSVKEIAQCLCFQCYDLKKVIFSKSLEYINDGAFSECISLESVNFPKTTKYVGIMGFSCCAKVSPIVLPDNMSWGIRAFEGCHMADYIAGSASSEQFSGWIGNITIADGVNVISSESFMGASMSKINIPSSVFSIGTHAFFGCTELTEVEWKEGTLSLEYLAFGCCNNLKQITIPASLIKIGFMCFDSSSIETVHFCGKTPPAIDYSIGDPNSNYDERSLFPLTNEGFKVMVPSAALSIYKTQWPLIADYIFGE